MGNNIISDGGNTDVYLTKFKSYVAILTQNFTVGIASGPLTVGKVYKINSYSEGDDFTNVGASENLVNTYFVATADTPAVWTNGSLLWSDFEPVAEVLNSQDDNYLGDIAWTRAGAGYFIGTLNNAFPYIKTYIPAPGTSDDPFGKIVFYRNDDNSVVLQIFDSSFTSVDTLYNRSISINVYQ